MPHTDKEPFRPRVWRWFRALPTRVLKTVEWLTVVGVFIASVDVGWWAVFGNWNDPLYGRKTQVLRLVGENWQAFLVLGIPLFYRTIRKFLEEVQEAFGMKRHPMLPSSAPTQQPNPPESE